MEISLIKKTPPVADLHCDLLCYLCGDAQRSPFDNVVRCSIPQLKKGNVKVQTLAIFTETSPGSAEKGTAQMRMFKELPKKYPEAFECIREAGQFQSIVNSEKIGILPAIENASSFCEENEDLHDALDRLTKMQHKIGKFTYVSLTWNTENRFGGGALTKIGLKEDGKKLIDYLCQHGIALDFSHASDYLAYDALNYIDKKQLNISLLASHSNFRSVSNVPRNLPDDLAKEILNRKGIIGLNFVRPFVGEDSLNNFSKQLVHALGLGFNRNVCLGADFFFDQDISPSHRKPANYYFFPSVDHAGNYDIVFDLWRKEMVISEEELQNISYNNLIAFLSNKMD